MSNLKIYSWNVNGIRAAVRNGLLDWVKKAKPDILCLQEIKAKEEDFPKEIFELGYHVYICSAEKKGYAGVAVLTKEEPKKVVNKIGKKEFDSEGRFLLLEFDKFYLFNTYFPNSQRELVRLNFKMKFNEYYLKFVEKLKGKPVLLTGDFNVAHNDIDLANPKQNEKNAGFTKEEREFIDKLESKGWVDIFRKKHPETVKYSWWTYRFNARKRNIGWRIDYFFIKEKYLKKIKKAEVHDDVNGSDHCPVSVEL